MKLRNKRTIAGNPPGGSRMKLYAVRHILDDGGQRFLTTHWETGEIGYGYGGDIMVFDSSFHANALYNQAISEGWKPSTLEVVGFVEKKPCDFCKQHNCVCGVPCE